MCCFKRRPKKGVESLREADWKLNQDIKSFNDNRDVINMVNKVNVLEVQLQEIEEIALAKFAEREKQILDSNGKENNKIIKEEIKSVNMAEMEILERSKTITQNKKQVKAINNIGKDFNIVMLNIQYSE